METALANKKLFNAIENGNMVDFIDLIEKGCDINIYDHGMTPLMFAISKGHEQMIGELLNRGANINAKDPSGMRIIHYACINNNINLVGRLIGQGVNINYSSSIGTPLTIAIENNNIPMIQMLINVPGINLNYDKSIGIIECPYLHNEISYNNEIIVQMLLDAGADINYSPPNDRGYTPLVHAIINNNSNMTLMLLSNGATVPDNIYNFMDGEIIPNNDNKALQMFVNWSAISLIYNIHASEHCLYDTTVIEELVEMCRLE